MPTTIAHRLTATALIACGIAATACACSSSDPTPTPAASKTSRTAAASTTPSTTASTPSAQALTAYRAMWNEVAEASNTSDYQAAYLNDHLSGKALLTITNNLAAENKQGIVAHGAPALHPVVTSATATSAAISDCLDDRAWLQVYASTGKPVDDIPGGFRSTTSTVVDIGGTWKVTQLDTGAEGTCKLGQ